MSAVLVLKLSVIISVTIFSLNAFICACMHFDFLLSIETEKTFNLE